MTIVTCPPPTDLEHLFLGGVPSAAVDCLEQHVLRCDACLQQLKGLLGTRETLAGLLRDDTGTDAFGQGTVVDALIGQLESLRPTTPRSSNPVAPMIAFTCSGCPRKLSVKADLAGKKIRCPGCGQITVVPVAVAVMAELQTLPPGASAAPADQAAPLPARDATVDADRPTVPPASKPDATHDNEAADAVDQPSLTDFLAPPQADDELGRLGKYRILKVLGHGGMGVVFKAEDPKLKRSVAIKAMLPTLAASASAGKRFLREAQAMAAVEHDHIVRIYQVDEERGVPFLAMEFLKGEPLDERLKREANVPVGEVLRIGREIAEALEAAHATGLIHRDVKPANVWLEAPRGRVKILDFGLARAATQESGLTQQGAIIGTPAYMAPEQARGETVDHRCDLFSLGVVLYRLSTRKLPFQGRDTISTLMEVALHAPAPPILANLEMPQELSDLVMKLLEKDPAQRFASAAAVVETLRVLETDLARRKATQAQTEAVAWTDNKTHQPRVQDARKGSPPSKKRRPIALIAAALAAAFGALICVAGGIVFFWPAADGTVRIEINDPDIQVAFDKKALVFKDIDKQVLRVSPGAHGLHVQRGELEFDTDKLVLKKGETITLKVQWLKNGRLQVVQDGKVIRVKSLPPVAVGPKEVIEPVASLPAVDDAAPAYELRFDGGQSVTLPPMPPIPAGPLTLELYVNVDRIFMPNGHALVETHSARIGVGGGWGPLWLNAGSDVLKASPLPAGMNHVAGVWAADEIRLFVNGKRVAAQKAGPRPESKSGGLLGRDFFGTMRGVRISKSARYDKDFTPPLQFEPDKDTIAVYRFKEGAGDVLKDSSGNGHDGKIIGAKWGKAAGAATTLPTLDPAWIKDVAAMQWMDQQQAVKAKLMERNPGFDGEVTFKRDAHGYVRELTFRTDQVTDISPVRALTDLLRLDCGGTASAKGKLADLSPLKGMRLTTLNVPSTAVADLSPLKDLPLQWLDMRDTPVTDLAPLKGMKLQSLSIAGSAVADLGPLRGMRLVQFWCDYSKVADLSPLKGMPITHLGCNTTKVTNLAPLQGMPLKSLTCPFQPKRDAKILRSIDTLEMINGKPAAEFWKQAAAAPSAVLTNSLGMEFAHVPKGRAWLGGRAGEPGNDEVEIPDDFYLGTYAVTQGEWERVMGNNPSQFKAVAGVAKEDQQRFPVEMVSWDDCQEFVKRLNKMVKDEGWVYRLPKRTEWEYSCRGGPMTDKAESAFDFYLEKPTNELLPKDANFSPGLGRTCKVGSYSPNRLGLFDMHGNVWQWCEDTSAPDTRIAMGGCWSRDADCCRAGRRDSANKESREPQVGLRVIRVHAGKKVESKLPRGFTNGLGMDLILVPSGKAWLGGRGGKVGDNEVEFKQAFFLGAHEVTHEQWEKVMGPMTNPSWFVRTGPGAGVTEKTPAAELQGFPVENVTWDEAQAFVTKLNERDKQPGWIYRLPTVAEWEYACRGGPSLPKEAYGFDFYFEKPSNQLLLGKGNFNNAAGRPCAVGSYPPNALGLYDMHGNVWEWCADPYDKEQRTARRRL